MQNKHTLFILPTSLSLLPAIPNWRRTPFHSPVMHNLSPALHRHVHLHQISIQVQGCALRHLSYNSQV